MKLVSETYQINKETGEVIAYEFKPITKQYIRQRFGVYFLEAVRTISEDTTLSHAALRIIMHLMGELLTGSEVAFFPRDLARKLGYKIDTIYKAVRELTNKSILLRTTAPNGSRTYRLNPRLVWRGSLENRPQDLSREPVI